MADKAIDAAAPSPGAAATSPTTTKPSRNKRFSILTRRDKTILALMVGIPLILDVLLIWGSAVADFVLSFTDWRGVGDITSGGRGHSIVGLQNYQQLFDGTYPFFWPAVIHNLLWLAFLMFVATPIGIFIAVLLDSGLKGQAFYRTAFYLPVVLSLALIGIIWELQYAPDANHGFINGMLAAIPRLGIPPFTWLPNIAGTDWLGDSSINLWAALIAASWRHVGYITILYLAGLKGFDPTLREAAAIDGANARQTFFHVVFPVMKPINIVIVVITTIEALRAFDLAYIINGGKAGLELLSTLITNNAISESDRVGFGSAIAVILAVVSLVPIVIFLTMQLREDQE